MKHLSSSMTVRELVDDINDKGSGVAWGVVCKPDGTFEAIVFTVNDESIAKGMMNALHKAAAAQKEVVSKLFQQSH